MVVARISIIRTSRDPTRLSSAKKAQVEHLPSMPDYIMGFRCVGHEDEDEVGRVSPWNAHEDADHAATLELTLALRSQIRLLID
jgi:hypothetical protein